MRVVQVVLDETQHGFEQGLARIIVLVHQPAADDRVRAVHGHGNGPVIGVDKSEQRAARNDLVGVDDLAVVSPVDRTQSLV